MRPLLCHLSYAALVGTSRSCRAGFYHETDPEGPGHFPRGLGVTGLGGIRRLLCALHLLPMSDQEASEDVARGAAGLGGSWRSTARHRSAADARFMSTGAASRMRKWAYSGV